MKKKLFGMLLLAVMLIACLATPAFADDKETLTAPVDFSFNPETGAFTFTTTDDNAGYYFVRVYPVVGGEEASEYVASSRRINAGKLGEKSGKVDVSSIGWGAYHIKLVTFAASGTNYAAPDPVIITACYGVGGVLEKPEMMVIADGNTAEFIVDWYSISDYYEYQFMPSVIFRVYSDEACTALVMTDTVNLNDLRATMDTHPAGGYIWGYSTTSSHPVLGSMGFANTVWPYTLPAGTYYATVQALSDSEDVIASSRVSDVVAFTLTDDAPNGEYTTSETALWHAPATMGVPCAKPGTYADRIDAAASQVTTSYAE
ncbi:MAG: hypothetical protein ACI4ME_10915 [Aristaeellaceae bacterium]